ncbi:Monovalent cation/H+ antiporter subunit D/L family protein [Candidatus Hepatincolaceae symbiont of Richtersius coronifer]
MHMNTLLSITVLIPFISIIPVILLNNRPNLREATSIILAILNTILLLLLFFRHTLGENAFLKFIQINDIIYFGLYTEKLNILFALLVNFLWVLSIIYSLGYLRAHHEKNQTRFFVFFALAIGSTLGLAFSANLLTLFLFYEILTLSTFPLVAHNINNNNKKQVATYLGVLIVSSMTLLLAGIILTYVYTGQGNFTPNGLYNAKHLNPYLVIGIFLLFLFGLAKTAIMPLHKWLPAAMVAPTPVSALLHAVAVVKAGAFALIKIVLYIFGIEYMSSVINSVSSVNWLLIIPAITIILASVIALFQTNLKKMLAYSTIGQLSYIVLAITLFSPTSVLGGFLYIFAHAFSKITLFFAAGSLIALAHKEDISELNGIAKKMPITILAFSVGALSLIGFPLTIGFIGKIFIIKGILESEQYFALIAIIISTVLNCIYLLPVIFRAFFSKDQHIIPTSLDHLALSPPNYLNSKFKFINCLPMDIAMIITSGAVIGLTFYSHILINILVN